MAARTISIRGSTSKPVQVDITLWRGEAISIVATITSTNITGWAISCIVRPKVREANEAFITKSVGSGIALTTPASGILTITLSATDTDLEPGSYDYTIARTDSGSEVVLTWGSFIVRKNTVLGTQTTG